MRNLCSLLTHNKKLVVFSWQKSVGLVQDFLSANSNPILHEQPTEKKPNDKLYSDADTHTPKANPKRWGVSRKQNSTVVSVYKDRDSPNNRNQWMQMSKGQFEITTCAPEFWRLRRKLRSDYSQVPNISIHVNCTRTKRVYGESSLSRSVPLISPPRGTWGTWGYG